MPVIKGNKVKYCRASGIITNTDVDSYVSSSYIVLSVVNIRSCRM